MDKLLKDLQKVLDKHTAIIEVSEDGNLHIVANYGCGAFEACEMKSLRYMTEDAHRAAKKA
jgi:hypothetical protein